MLALVPEVDWHSSAACVGTSSELFFGGKSSDADALALCAVCVVRDECATETFEIERHVGGVFGVRAGMTASERQALLRR